MLPFPPRIAALPRTIPFVGPERQERDRGGPFAARLGANENPFGPSPKAIAAMAEAARDVWQYGDPENHDLVEALAAHHGVPPSRISVGEGIDAILGNAVRLFTDDGTPIVSSAGAYPTFLYHVRAVGGRPHLVPYHDDHEDPDALLAAAAETGAPLVYLANPDNPMGTFHDAARVLEMIETLPPTAILLLDEAYGEFAPAGDLLPDDFLHPRLIRLRTFSKAYAMAGARIGYALASPELAGAFDLVRNHFGVNRVAQAGALAALSDAPFLASVLANVASAKARIAEIGAAHGLRALPSATNFVTLDTGRSGDTARALVAALAAEGIFVRMPFVAPQDRCIRISAGPDAILDALALALPRALARLPAAEEA